MRPRQGREATIPEEYMKAFQDAAGRYELGQSGVWALAAVARVESNFGKGMSAEDLASRGPLGITEDNWSTTRSTATVTARSSTQARQTPLRPSRG